jgi:hypothetical protein
MQWVLEILEKGRVLLAKGLTWGFGDLVKLKLTKGQKKGLGVLGVVAIFFLMVISYCDYDPVIENGVVKETLYLNQLDTLESTISDILREAYTTAHYVSRNNPDIEGIEIILSYSKYGLVDKYGNELKSDITMGKIRWGREQIKEILKYVDKDAYIYYKPNRAFVMLKIKQMPGSHLLKD